MARTPQRILVVANETINGNVLIESVAALAAAPGSDVLALAPALNSKLAYWTSSDGDARRAAELRLARCVELLTAIGVQVEGLVGDADPLRAIEDALRLYPADQIVIATHPEERSHWLAHDIVDRVRQRFDRPVIHVIVDSEHGAEHLVGASASRAAAA